jgi:Ca-activated chloride channel family protein
LIITDGANHSQDDIRKDDVKLFEDKVEQTILSFERDTRAIDYAMVIDTSQSLREVLPDALEAARLVITNNRTSDETFIERFVSSDLIEKTQDFTSDKSLLITALHSLRLENGLSSVLDAIYRAVDYTAKHGQKDQRKAIVLISDGEDRSSLHDVGSVVKLLHETNIQVFVIGIVFKLDDERGFIRGSSREAAEKLLSSIAEESGGRLFFAKNLGEMATAIREIVHDLHGQFVITYQPATPSQTGLRKVKVQLVKAPGREKWKVISPRGYYNNPASPKPNN